MPLRLRFFWLKIETIVLETSLLEKSLGGGSIVVMLE